MKLVHLVGFITKKFVTLHGHTNIKKECIVIYVKSQEISYVSAN
jgi:hypothetical protein